MWVNVTQEDIAAGDAALDACPITIALRRKFGKDVSVSRDFIRVPVNHKQKWVLVPLPTKAREFILNLSMYQFIKPFKFQILDAHIDTLKQHGLLSKKKGKK